jgi:SAM-dependent methyltransferase
MQRRHSDRGIYFREQVYTTGRYVIPFIEEIRPVEASLKVLEVGCGEGGNLVTFLEKGCEVTGVDLSGSKIEAAKEFFDDHPHHANIHLFAKDIYESGEELAGPYDIIFMRDVIEHIHDQDRFMGFIRNFLKEDGIFFLAFPPWYNPFGGHQQICENRFLSKLPYFHLFPEKIYKWILRTAGESEKKIEALVEIKETGISIERFERVFKKHGYKALFKRHFFINPNYEVKFGLKPRRQWTLLAKLPYIRDFFTTTSYYLIMKAGGAGQDRKQNNLYNRS